MQGGESAKQVQRKRKKVMEIRKNHYCYNSTGFSAGSVMTKRKVKEKGETSTHEGLREVHLGSK
jgi:hypothetical protein